MLQRQRLAQSVTPDNPVMRKLEDEIAGLRAAINSSINSVLEGLATRRKDLMNQANLYSGRIGSMPTQEREFLDLSREQQIKANLFLMLLQKREENALELAATANSAKVLDEALSEGIVSPRFMLVLLTALLLGILLPSLLLYLRDLLQYKITTRGDVEKISKVPVMSEIPHHDEKSNVVVKEGGDNSINEAFRIARTNLLLSLGADNKVVLITSTVSGEGTTFITINLAISTALLNKRVLLVDSTYAPPAANYMGFDEKMALPALLGFERLDSLVKFSGVHENLFVLPAGAIPRPCRATFTSNPTKPRNAT